MWPLELLIPFNEDHLEKPIVNSIPKWNEINFLNTEIKQKFSGPIQRVLSHFAMEPEAQNLLDHFGFKQCEVRSFKQNTSYAWQKLKPNIYQKEFDQITVELVTNGSDPRFGVEQVGTGPTALALFAGISSLAPQLIINAGTAGGFKEHGGKIGDIYLGSGVVFHDHRIPHGVYEIYGKGLYPVLDNQTLSKTFGLKEGLISTGNSLDCSPEDLTALRKTASVAKDMEAAEAARIAHAFELPFITIKAVSDFVGHSSSTSEQFLSNFSLATGNLTDKLIKLLNFLDSDPNRRLEEI